MRDERKLAGAAARERDDAAGPVDEFEPPPLGDDAPPAEPADPVGLAVGVADTAETPAVDAARAVTSGAVT